MIESYQYRLTTIERLAPSLEEIDFQLTKTALDEQPIESLNLSVSIEKIQSQCYNDFDAGLKEKEQFKLEDRLIEVAMTKPKLKLKDNLHECKTARKTIKSIKTTSQKKQEKFDEADPKIKLIHLSTTASTLKNLSPSRGNSPKDYSMMDKKRVKKSITFRAKPSIFCKNNQKFAPYLQSTKVKLQQKNKGPREGMRGKLLSTRK